MGVQVGEIILHRREGVCSVARSCEQGLLDRTLSLPSTSDEWPASDRKSFLHFPRVSTRLVFGH